MVTRRDFIKLSLLLGFSLSIPGWINVFNKIFKEEKISYEEVDKKAEQGELWEVCIEKPPVKNAEIDICPYRGDLDINELSRRIPFEKNIPVAFCPDITSNPLNPEFIKKVSTPLPEKCIILPPIALPSANLDDYIEDSLHPIIYFLTYGKLREMLAKAESKRSILEKLINVFLEPYFGERKIRAYKPLPVKPEELSEDILRKVEEYYWVWRPPHEDDEARAALIKYGSNNFTESKFVFRTTLEKLIEEALRPYPHSVKQQILAMESIYHVIRGLYYLALGLKGDRDADVIKEVLIKMGIEYLSNLKEVRKFSRKIDSMTRNDPLLRKLISCLSLTLDRIEDAKEYGISNYFMRDVLGGFLNEISKKVHIWWYRRWYSEPVVIYYSKLYKLLKSEFEKRKEPFAAYKAMVLTDYINSRLATTNDFPFWNIHIVKVAGEELYVPTLTGSARAIARAIYVIENNIHMFIVDAINGTYEYDDGTVPYESGFHCPKIKIPIELLDEYVKNPEYKIRNAIESFLYALFFYKKLNEIV